VITLRDLEGFRRGRGLPDLGLTEANQSVLLHRARSRVRRALETISASTREKPRSAMSCEELVELVTALLEGALGAAVPGGSRPTWRSARAARLSRQKCADRCDWPGGCAPGALAGGRARRSGAAFREVGGRPRNATLSGSKPHAASRPEGDGRPVAAEREAGTPAGDAPTSRRPPGRAIGDQSAANRQGPVVGRPAAAVWSRSTLRKTSYAPTGARAYRPREAITYAVAEVDVHVALPPTAPSEGPPSHGVVTIVPVGPADSVAPPATRLRAQAYWPWSRRSPAL